MKEHSALPAVIVYSRPMCEGCAEVKDYLEQQGIAFIEKDIRADITTMIEFRRKGYDVLPVIEIGEQKIREYESLDQLRALLAQTGYSSY